MNNSAKNRVNSCGNKEEVPFEAICTSAEWIREDVQAVAEAFSLNSETLLKAVLDQFGSGAVLTRSRKSRVQEIGGKRLDSSQHQAGEASGDCRDDLAQAIEYIEAASGLTDWDWETPLQ